MKRIGEDAGFQATLEKSGLGGAGSVDVALERPDLKIAVEISVSTDAQHELGNLQKCLDAGFARVVLLSPDAKLLNAANSSANVALSGAGLSKLQFILPERFSDLLNAVSNPTPATIAVPVKRRLPESSSEHARARESAVLRATSEALRD